MANSVSVGILFWLLFQKARASVVSPGLAESTISVAMAYAAGDTLAATGAASLAEEVILSTVAGRRKIGYLVLSVILLLGVGGLVSASWMYESAVTGQSSSWQGNSPPPSLVEGSSLISPLFPQANDSTKGQTAQAAPSCHNK